MVNVFTVLAEEFVKKLTEFPPEFHDEYIYFTTVYTGTPAMFFSQTITDEKILQCQTGMFGFADDCADRDVAYGVPFKSIGQDFNFDTMTPSDMLNITYDDVADQVCFTMHAKSSVYFPCKKLDSVSKLFSKFTEVNTFNSDSWQVCSIDLPKQETEKEITNMSKNIESTEVSTETSVEVPAMEVSTDTSKKRARRSSEEIAREKEGEAIDFLVTRGYKIEKTTASEGSSIEAAAAALESLRVSGTAIKVALGRLENERTALLQDIEEAKKKTGEVLSVKEQAIINALRAV